MKPDLELESWREQWQAQSEVPADLRRKVERGSRRLRLMLAGEVAVTVGIGGWATASALTRPRTETLVLALATWMFIGAAWLFAMVNRRGTWSPEAESTAKFVELSIRRCRRRLEASKFGVVLYFVEMAFCLAWLYRDPARRHVLPAAIFGTVTPVFLVGMAVYRRQIRLELARLLELLPPC